MTSGNPRKPAARALIRAPAEVFISYAHADATACTELVEHLSLLRRQRMISTWYDGMILPGDDLDVRVRKKLESADIIVLLISKSFMASDFCCGVELRSAMSRHESGTTRVVPVMLSPCDVVDAPFTKLKVLPANGSPISTWANKDDAWAHVASGIRQIAEDHAPRRESQYNAPLNEHLDHDHAPRRSPPSMKGNGGTPSTRRMSIVLISLAIVMVVIVVRPWHLVGGGNSHEPSKAKKGPLPNGAACIYDGAETANDVCMGGLCAWMPGGNRGMCTQKCVSSGDICSAGGHCIIKINDTLLCAERCEKSTDCPLKATCSSDGYCMGAM